MVRPLARLFAVTAVLAQIVAACDGELNPQPLPPANSENGGKATDGTATGSTGDNATPGAADAGASYQDDGGRGLDGGDGGDASDAGDGG